MCCQSICSHIRLILAPIHSVPESSVFFHSCLFPAGSDVVSHRLKNIGPVVEYYSTAELQAVQIRLCRSPIWNWQRHSPFRPILFPLTSALAWHGTLGVCWATNRSANPRAQCFLMQTVVVAVEFWRHWGLLVGILIDQINSWPTLLPTSMFCDYLYDFSVCL